jgi:hypothetical protein
VRPSNYYLPNGTLMRIGAHSNIFLDSRVITSYMSGLSLLALAVHAIAVSKPVRNLRARFTSYQPLPEEDGEASGPSLQRRIHAHGGVVIFGFKVVRAEVAAVLLALTAYGVFAASSKPSWTHIALLATTVRRVLPIDYLIISLNIQILGLRNPPLYRCRLPSRWRLAYR